MIRIIKSDIPGVREVVRARATDEEVTSTKRDGTVGTGPETVRSVHLSHANLEPFECTARILAYLLVPDTEDRKQRVRIYNVMCCSVVRAGLAWPRQRRSYVFQNEKRFNTAINDICGLVAHRDAAALMALPPLLRNFGDFALPAKGAMAELVTEFLKEKSPKNVLHRVWKPTLPVLHLAVAAYMMTLELPGGLLGLLPITGSADYLLAAACDHEQHIRATPALKDAWPQLIRFSRD